MNHLTNILLKIIFILTITAFVLLILGAILFDTLSLEFKDEKFAIDLPIIFLLAIPFGIMLTLTGTIKKGKTKEKNWTAFGLTLFITVATFFIIYFLAINSAGVWTNELILFRNKSDNKISINKQIYDLGALGHDRESIRIVKVKPFVIYFNQVTKIDTAKLDKKQWLTVNESGNIHD